jgi:hypothetical protein
MEISIFYVIVEVKLTSCGFEKMMEILWRFQYPENIVNCAKICVKSPINPIYNEKLILHII